MEMVKVVSSQIDAVGYNKEAKQLDIQFKGGSVYRYDNVEADLHEKLMNQDSVGSYFINFIKRDPQKYPYTKLRGPDVVEEKRAAEAAEAAAVEGTPSETPAVEAPAVEPEAPEAPKAEETI
jgi:hypothetical protein